MANAGDEAAVKRAGEREISMRERELADVKTVMSSPAGRRWTNRIIQKSEVMGEVFNPNGSITNKNLGKREVGLFVYGELEQSCPDLFLLMRQEYVKESSNV